MKTSLALAAIRSDRGQLSPSPAPTQPRPLLRLVDDAATYIPIAEPHDLSNECPTLRLVSSRVTQTVLIGESQEDALSMLSFHLGSQFEVIRACDGDEALRLAIILQPDLAILDVRLDKMNGYDVTRRLRRHAATYDLPVILLDEHPQQIDTARGYAVGADDYVARPLDDPERLLARIADILDR